MSWKRSHDGSYNRAGTKLIVISEVYSIVKNSKRIYYMIDGNKPCFEYFITGRKAGPNVTNNQTDRHFVVTTAVDMFQRRWLTFLQAVDRSSMSSLTDVVLDVGEMGPVDTPLVDVRTDTAVTLRHYSGASRERAGPLLVVLLRHFA